MAVWQVMMKYEEGKYTLQRRKNNNGFDYRVLRYDEPWRQHIGDKFMNIVLGSISDYEDVLSDKRRLTREIDVLLNGKEGAAKQASLCDVVAQIEKLVETIKLQAFIFGTGDEPEGILNHNKDGWMLIDSAPKDGTDILAARIYKGKLVCKGVATWGICRPQYDGLRAGGGVALWRTQNREKCFPSPTHYMLMPSTNSIEGYSVDEILTKMENKDHG